MLGDLSTLHTEKVIERGERSSHRALTGYQHEISFPQSDTHPRILHTLSRAITRRDRRQPGRRAVANRRIVLNQSVAIEILPKLLHPFTDQNVTDETAGEVLVGLSLGRGQFLGHGRPVKGTTTAGIGGFGCGLKLIPMFDNEAVFVAENVEANVGPEKIEKIRVDKDVLAVLEDPERVDAGGAVEGGEDALHAGEAVRRDEAMLDIEVVWVGGVDGGEGSLIAGFDGFHDVEDLLVAGGVHGDEVRNCNQ